MQMTKQFSGKISSKYELKRSPDHDNEGWPPGVPYIIGNEGCERFSYYGMKSILTLHLVSLFTLAGAAAKEAEAASTAGMHTFGAAVYFFPLLGAILSDRLIGKFNTTFWLSLVYCAGHVVMSAGDFFVESPEGKLRAVWLGLGLIAVGSGGIKPVVSANVGDQFGKKNWHRVKSMFQAFYFIINFGSFFATLMIPWVRTHYGAGIAFLVPGVLMGIATFIFYLGKRQFVHVPPLPSGKLGALDVCSGALFLSPIGIFLFWHDGAWLGLKGALSLVGLIAGYLVFNARQSIEEDDGFLAVMLHALKNRLQGNSHGGFWGASRDKFGDDVVDGPQAVLRIVSVMFLVTIFWGLFDQHGSTWILQAKEMDLDVTIPWYGGMHLEADQIPALNPLMVMILIPLMNGIYIVCDSLGLKTTPLRRMTVGMFVAAASFASVAIIQQWIETQDAKSVSVLWQVVPYTIITIAEVMVSITGLEFAYTQAPPRMKSTLMGFWKLTVSMGNKLIAVVATMEFARRSDFFWFFAVLMAISALLFGIRARFYTSRDFTQI